ncbi:MAG: hypothetical protein ACKVRP_04610 [Bacteroidota bacterium]
MLRLNCIAEEIVAQMFSKSILVRELFAKKKPSLQNMIVKAAAHAEIKLHHCSEYRFDGAHAIDVGFIDTETAKVVPCEVKLGFERLSSSQFTSRFMKQCRVSHNGQRIAGQMVAVLDGNLPDICEGHSVTAVWGDKAFDLSSEWYLVLRQSVIAKWDRTSKPALSERCTIVSFEDIVESFGSTNDFNGLVSDYLQFDYFKGWLGTI